VYIYCCINIRFLEIRLHDAKQCFSERAELIYVPEFRLSISWAAGRTELRRRAVYVCGPFRNVN